MLTDESKKRVKELCDLIAKEQDHRRFISLLAELNQVLDRNGSSNSSGDKGNGSQGPASATPQKPV
jgi:hypothetical protein